MLRFGDVPGCRPREGVSRATAFLGHGHQAAWLWWTLGVLVTVGVCGPAFGQGGVMGSVRIVLRPNPSRVPADGRTMSRIRAEVKDSQGHPAPDGTQLAFRIEGGHLTRGGNERLMNVTVQTVRGFAEVLATSTQVGTATVHVDALGTGASDEVRIYFVEEGAAAAAESGVVHVRGSWVGYAPEAGVIEARGDNCEIILGAVRIKTDDMAELGVMGLTVKATEATIIAGDASLSGEGLYYDAGCGWGVIRRFSDMGVEKVFFDAYTLEKIEPKEGVPEGAFRPGRTETDLWYVARSISVFPYQKVVLRHATAYVGTKRLLKLPEYWVVAMAGYTGTTHSQIIGVNSEGNLAVDLPYFYRVTDNASGAIKLQHGATGASVVARPHWTAAVEEAYDTGRTEGAVTIAGLPRDDWGIEWRDSRAVWGGREGHFAVYSPDHRSLFADANVYEWGGDYRLNLRTRFEKPTGQGGSYGATADWLTYGRPIESWNASYRLGTALGLRHSAGADRGVVGEHEVYTALDFARANLGGSTSLTPSVSNLFAWDTGGYRYESLRGELRLRHIVSSSVSFGLTYEARLTSGDYSKGLEHVFGFDGRWYGGRKWHTYLTSTYEVPSDEVYAYLLLDYYPCRRWRVGGSAMYYRLAQGSYDDFEVTVTREVYGREVGLRWSEESQTVSLELGGFGSF